jgi:glycogen(starch) synthase
MQIRTVMLGWEFPPFISGGLGTACYGLTKAMDRLGMPVIFVLPRAAPECRSSSGALAVVGASADYPGTDFRHVRFRSVSSALAPYRPGPGDSRDGLRTRHLAGIDLGEHATGNYGPDIGAEVQAYALRVLEVTEGEEFDLIHAHDWMTFPAAVALAADRAGPFDRVRPQRAGRQPVRLRHRALRHVGGRQGHCRQSLYQEYHYPSLRRRTG